MSNETIKWDFTYAHCVKATPGKLDREPWYQYEQRLVMLTAEPVMLDYEEPPKHGFKVTAPDGTQATEESMQDAVSSVAYRLMAQSREAAELGAGVCLTCHGTGKVTVGKMADDMSCVMDCPECTGA